jgi:hypothetical protein
VTVALRRALVAAPAVVLGVAAGWALMASSVTILGHRGAARVTSGFRPGRFDARFLVARGPASLELPRLPLAGFVWLSGPALLRVGADSGERRYRLGSDPQPIELTLPRGGDVAIAADAPVRLHRLRVRRSGPPAHARALALALLTLAAGAAAARRPAWWSSLLAAAVVAAGGVLLVRGSFGELALWAAIDRGLPLAVVAAVLASVFVVRGVPRASPQARGDIASLRLPLLFGPLALASFVAQVLLLPQPQIVGDPAAYYEIAGRTRDAFAGAGSLDGIADALQTLRPYAGLAFTAAAYAGLRALADDPMAIYLGHAVALALAVAFLVRAASRMGGARLAVLAGAFALAYPTFAVLCGIVQPEPFILLAWTWALDRWLEATARGDRRGQALAGLAAGVGLALHPQGIWFLLAALALVLAPFLWKPGTPARRGAAAFAIGLLPVVLATAVGERYAAPVAPVLDERHGFWAYTTALPLGFWLFLDTDGWQGPLRIDDTRYARELQAEQQRGGARTALGRLGFTARFVVENASASTRTILRNLYRLFHVPDNPGRRDWILPHSLQVRWHRVIVVLFVIAAVRFSGPPTGVIYVPVLMLAMTYPLYHVFNKYAVPATPFLILGAAAAVAWLAATRDALLLGALLLAGAGAAVGAGQLALLGLPPPAAGGLVAAAHWGGLTLALVAAARLVATRGARAAAAAGGLFLVVPSVAAAWGDPGRLGFSVSLERRVEHEVLPGTDGVARLDAAREAYVLFDLHLPDGDPSPLRIAFADGPELSGAALEPCMPRFGLATTRFGRDPRTFRQWWRLPWQAGMATGGRVQVSLRGGSRARLFGALAAADASRDPGPSLGHWPHLSVYRLMHDDEYRLEAPQTLAGQGRASRVEGRRLPGILGIRLVVLDDETGGAAWETVPAPSREVVTAVWARSSADRAELLLDGGARALQLDARAAPETLRTRAARYVPTGEREGWWMIRTQAQPGRPLALELRLAQELAAEPRYFLPEPRPRPPIPLDWAGLPYVPLARVLTAKEAPHWRPALIF